MSNITPPQDPNDNKDQSQHSPAKVPRDDFLLPLIDFGNSISEVRESLIPNLKLLEKDFIQLHIIDLIYPEMMFYLYRKIGFYEGKLSTAKEFFSEKQTPVMYAWLETQIEADTFNRDIYRHIRYIVYRVEKGKSQDILEKIKIPPSLGDFIKYNINFNILILFELLNAMSLALKNVDENKEHSREMLETILLPKAKKGMINALPKMDKIDKLKAGQDDLRLFEDKELINIVESFMKDLGINLDEPHSDLCLATGLRHTSLKNLNSFLEYHHEQYKDTKTDFYTFVELAIMQYKKYIGKNQRKLANKWIKKQRNESKNTPPKIKEQIKFSTSQDKTKFQWRMDLKYLTNFFKSLTELNQLEATKGEIMSFIHCNFIDKNSKPFELTKLKRHLGEDVEPQNEQMRWIDRPSDLGYVWVNLYKSNQTPQKYLFVHKPEKKRILKLLMKYFVGKDGGKLSEEALKKYLNPSYNAHKNADDKLDVRQLMKFGK